MPFANDFVDLTSRRVKVSLVHPELNQGLGRCSGTVVEVGLSDQYLTPSCLFGSICGIRHILL